MVKLRQYLLSLCCVLLFCVGFSSANKVYAFEAEQNLYPYIANDVRFRFIELVDGNKVTSYDETLTYKAGGDGHPNLTNFFYLHNEQLNNVAAFAVTSPNTQNSVQFPFLPEIYDYYIVGNLFASIPNSGPSTAGLSTWKPTRMRLFGYDNDASTVLEYDILEQRFYNFDSDRYRGFSFWVKPDFMSAGQNSIRGFELDNDIHGTGSKPPNQYFQMAILAIPKGTNQTETLERILEVLVEAENNIVNSIEGVSDAVSDAAKELQETIEKQYEVEEDENLGIDDMTQDLENKLGILSFGGDVLEQFVAMFDESNAGDPTLVFPSFAMSVQGESYKIWDDQIYDLRDLERQYPVLIDAVRMVFGLILWLLLFNYIVKIADEFLRS